jgi:DNA-binding MarR family transcriptional regulator
MDDGQQPDAARINTIALLGRAYSRLGFQIVDGVVGAGFPQKPRHSAVFAQIRPEGSRLSDLARGANMTPQSMGEIVDELEELGYVERRADPSDRRAKLVTLTARGRECLAAGEQTIRGLESDIDAMLGTDGHAELRRMLERLVAEG